MTGPLEREFAQVRTSLDTLHYYGAAERHTDDQCPVCGACDEGYDALSAIERHVQDMESAIEEWAFDQGYDSVSSESIVVDIRNRAAALPAREKEEE